MHLACRLFILLGLASGSAMSVRATEHNFWPLWVGQTDDDRITEVTPWWSWTAIGPLLFSKPVASVTGGSPARGSGLRPIYFRRADTSTTRTDTYVLYPLFWHSHYEDNSTRWSIFSLVNYYSGKPVTSSTETNTHGFDLWPFYFSRQTGSPDTSYRALFPIAGTVRNRFSQDRFSWILFPLYGRFEKNNVVTTTTPWPFVKVLRGEGNHGFELWPLFGRRQKEGVYREQFYLWPLIYRNEKNLSAPEPEVRSGFIPFYLSDSGPGFINKSFSPFFGYTDRTQPYRYHETRYFWPLFVQGRGDDRLVNRWGPFYSHSNIKGVDKTWVAWPLWRQRQWNDGKLAHTQHQFLYFVYYANRQRDALDPSKPAGHKTHLWPLFTVWDNGAGRKQMQALSPFEVFFPHNETVRQLYSPLVALYRYDRSAPGSTRHSFLWNFVTWRREPAVREFHLGPLLGSESHGRQKRYTLLAGLLGIERAESGRWRPLFFNFKRRGATNSAARDTATP